MSISPFWSAATWVWASEIQIHSTRSTLATLPPAGRWPARCAACTWGLDVDGLLAGLPFVAREDERAGADHVLGLDLVLGSWRDARRHHEGHVRRRLAERLQDQAVGLLHLHLEVLGSTTSKSMTEAIIFWPIESWRPALDRGDAIFGGDGLAVAPLQAVAQVNVQVSLSAETSYLSTICGLTSNFSSIANSVSQTSSVIAHDVGGGPDRIEIFRSECITTLSV